MQGLGGRPRKRTEQSCETVSEPNSMDNQMFLIHNGDFFKSICKCMSGLQMSSRPRKLLFHLDHSPRTDVETIPRIRFVDSCTTLTAIMKTVFLNTDYVS